MADVRVKICGLKRPEEVAAAAEAGANYCGFVFFPKSPRNISIDQAAGLALDAPIGLAKVALVVDPDDALLDAITSKVPLDMIQLHGKETPERVKQVKSRYGLPVMKAVGIANAEDVANLDPYEDVADQILVDAKKPKGGDLPGGNGLAFDWRLIAGRAWRAPWMLAGGLNPDNVAQAVALTGARQVDLSSGVESAPGVKDITKFAPFIRAAQADAPPRL